MNINTSKFKELSLFDGIDHIAIAVNNLQQSLFFYQKVLGLEIVEQRETKGQYSGMVSAVLSAGNFTIVLVQGTSEQSQVSRYIEHYGMGVQHVAFAVNNIETAVSHLKGNGMEFATSVIQGDGLKQIFSKRDENSGMMFEVIERTGEKGFQEDNIQSLFDQLEAESAF